MKKPLLSVIIVNFNGLEYVRRSVKSVFLSETKNLEVIVVDNGSEDKSPEMLEKEFAQFGTKFSVVKLKKNFGPAKARNEGVKRSKGELLAFLDNDTLVDQNWAQIAIKEFRERENLGAIQCKLLLAKERDKIDYVGEYLGQNGFLVQRVRAGEKDTGLFEQKCDILAAKSAGMFIRKKVFRLIGGFDDDYFIYVEETDLGWRVWLSGYTVEYLPKSIVYHEFGTSGIILGKAKNNYNAKFHGCKNYILTLAKNLQAASLIQILPIHVFLWIGLAWFALLKRDFKSFYWIHKAIFWNIFNIGKTARKRRVVQKKRKITDRELFKIVMRKKPFLYFVRKATVSHEVGNAEGFTKKRN